MLNMAKCATIRAIFFLLVTYVGVEVHGVAVAAKSAKNVRGESVEECLNDPRCAFKSNEIRSFINPSIQPCDDFYEFSCGKWPGMDVLSTGYFSDKISEEMSAKVADILKDTTASDLTENDKKIIHFYQSCMKLRDIPRGEHKSSFESIIAEFGSMPALAGANWDGSAFNWYETLGRIYNKYGIETIVGVDIVANPSDNSSSIIVFGGKELLMKKKSMYTGKTSAPYRTVIENFISEKLGEFLQIDSSTSKEVAKNIIEFETKLAMAMTNEVFVPLDGPTVLIEPPQMSVKYAPFLNVARFIELAFGETANIPVYEYNEGFQRNLGKVLDSVSKETLANYIFFNLVKHFFPQVFHDEETQHSDCAVQVKRNFPKLFNNMIYRRYKLQSTKSDVNAIWLKLKETFDRQLNSETMHFFSPKVLEFARTKLNHMKLEINTHEDTNFNNEMQDYNIDNNDHHYIENLKSIFQNNIKKKLKKLHATPTLLEADNEFSEKPNYNERENKITISVPFLQYFNFWSGSYPKSIMYSTLGFLIGHELFHGFNDNGRFYDESGNWRFWWDEKSTAQFNKRSKCFAEQYHNYVFGGIRIPLSESQAENIADNGALRLAYNAYVNWLSNNDEDRKLPQLDEYSSKQLFFISFAQMWCSDVGYTMQLMEASTKMYIPAKFRAIGVLSNNEDFANEFKCMSGAKMNPASKCRIY